MGQAAAYPYFEDKPTHQRSTMSANDPKWTLATTGGLAELSKTMLRREARLLRARTVEGVAIAAGSTKRMTPRRIPRAAYTGRFDQTVEQVGKCA